MNQLFQQLEYRWYAVLGILAFFNTLLFIAPQTSSLTLITTSFDNAVFYTGFLLLGALTIGSVTYFSKKFSWQTWLLHSLLIWLPAVVTLVYGLSESNNFHYVFIVGVGFYVILSGILATATYIIRHPLQPSADLLSFRAWWQAQGKVPLTLVTLLTLLFLGFGSYHLTQYAAVDEPLWLDGRIHRYWKNIGERDWDGTNISDKPGITVALATGIGTLFKSSMEYRTTHFNGEVFNLREGVEEYYFAFRFPELVVITLFLPLFYFFSERLFGRRTALFIYAFLATSPVLIGIAKIINPDSLLWVFTSLSLLSYFLFRSKQLYRYLILAGVFLGLALLTKYIANILFVFFLGLIFLEYLFEKKSSTASLIHFLKSSLQQFAVLTFAALTTFYFFFPAVWVKPEKILKSTLFSQAFEKVAPLFLTILFFILLDQWLNQARITAALLGWLRRWKHFLIILTAGIFLVSLLATCLNTWFGMSFYDFSSLLASPKSISTKSGFLGAFLTNFYPLAFAITPLTLLMLTLTPWLLWLKREHPSRPLIIAWYALIFMLLYYLGATVNGVASIVRYQIVIFPLAAIVAGIALATWLEMLEQQLPHLRRYLFAGLFTFVTLTGATSLFLTEFPLSYASSLLPMTYHIDVKDMGGGSYKAAEWLNTLPNAENLLIWTDKDGVCKFFVGRCKRGLSYESLREDGLDYIVVSAGRESRTTKMMGGDIKANKPGLIRFDEYYTRTDPVHLILINDRPTHFVKIFSFTESNPTR